jgi:hypothetical protein
LKSSRLEGVSYKKYFFVNIKTLLAFFLLFFYLC